jgi:valyl-tRNA synthetase
MALNKHFESASVEKSVSEKWISQEAFQAGINAKEGQPSYTIMIPPPNVTGVLHMGHAFNNTLQDILIRHKVL